MQRHAARELNDRLIRKYPESYFDLVVAHEQLGSLAEEDGLREDAINHYRRSLYLSAESNRHGDAALRLPELLTAPDADPEQWDEAAKLLAAINPDRDFAFSSQRFRYNVLRARLAENQGDMSMASAFAEAALAEWHRTKPDFTRHPTLGWVKSPPETLSEMARLADGA